jgi:hypothetical protein
MVHNGGDMNLQIATLTIPPFWQEEAVLLAKSLRQLGEDFANIPVNAYSLEDRPVSDDLIQELSKLEVETHHFKMDEETQQFPLAIVPFGAAAAESHLTGQCDVLIWLLPDTLVLNSPDAFALAPEISLGIRPVHHRNIGSDYNQPPDEFWHAIYKHLEVPTDRFFPMQTCYRETIRPYYNAGFLVTRPENRLFQEWLQAFLALYKHSDFAGYYQDLKYAIFMHQAVLSGVILNRFPSSQITELPESYNYPLHMHADYPQGGKVSQLSELVTARYENTKDLHHYLERFDDASDFLALLE